LPVHHNASVCQIQKAIILFAYANKSYVSGRKPGIGSSQGVIAPIESDYGTTSHFTRLKSWLIGTRALRNIVTIAASIRPSADSSIVRLIDKAGIKHEHRSSVTRI
jgi:hypothetical protein